MNFDKELHALNGSVIKLNFIDMEQPNFTNVKVENFEPYFELIIDGCIDSNRYYTNLFHLDDSGLFLISEWAMNDFTIESLKAAIQFKSMRLHVFDVAKMKRGVVSFGNSRIVPMCFENNLIIYTKETGSVIKEFEVSVSDIKWEDVVLESLE